jgi:hypothetical protein
VSYFNRHECTCVANPVRAAIMSESNRKSGV